MIAAIGAGLGSATGGGSGISSLATSFIGSSGTTNTSGSTTGTTQSLSDSDTAALQALIQALGGQNSQYSRQNAIADSQGFADSALKSLKETGLPQILANQTTAGAYNSTSAKQLSDDLTARTATDISANTANTVANYAQINNQNDAVLASLYSILKGASTTSSSQSSSQVSNVNPGILGFNGNMFGGDPLGNLINTGFEKSNSAITG